MPNNHCRRFAELSGRKVEFVQDNHGLSAEGVLSGLHYQIRQPQGKPFTEAEYFV